MPDISSFGSSTALASLYLLGVLACVRNFLLASRLANVEDNICEVEGIYYAPNMFTDMIRHAKSEKVSTIVILEIKN